MSNFLNTRTIANGREAKTRRTIVVDQSFVMRPLIKGSGVGEYEDQRLFQNVYLGDYIITTTKEPGFKFPHISVTRHNENGVIAGTYATEVLNRIQPLLAEYLLNYSL